jgi:NAD-dependent DNA ligase
MNSVTQDILNFIDIEDDKNISLFINIVRNYYYNNDLPSIKEQAIFKEWFKLKNIKEIETFLSNISDELYDKIIEITGMNGKILDNVNDIGATPHNKKCNLPVFMGSLNKIKTEEDFMNWMKKNNSSEMIITEKLDGISALLSITEYEVKLYTRGNGKIGCDISHLVQYLDLNKCIEKTRKYYNEFPVYIRGELIMEKINKSNETENIRNIVSGIVHTKDITKEIINKLKDVHFVEYRL